MPATRTIDSPVGRLVLTADEAGLTGLVWERGATQPDVGEKHPVIDAAARQLRAYFAGRLTRFDLPLAFHGTDFQKRVWAALLTIPYGETRSYGEIARAIGAPDASRAVGAANGRNPISIIAPCHRVIGTNGALTGFGGGIANKRFLLQLESKAPRLDGL